jgi:hypothetical protein
MLIRATGGLTENPNEDGQIPLISSNLVFEN